MAISITEPPAATEAAGRDRLSVAETDDMDAAGNSGDERPLTIVEVARKFGTTPRALRFYETKRLLNPQRRGPIRLYRRGDCERLALIQTGRRLGFTLLEIGILLGWPDDGTGLKLTREQCVAQINLLERQKRSTEIALAELRQIYTSFYKKQLDEIGAPFSPNAPPTHQ